MGVSGSDHPVMERFNFEPFGERLTQQDRLRHDGRASKWLLRIGSTVFWSLVAGIVLARAVYFDPGVFAGLDRLAGLVRSVF
jgi:hypothetical protein